MIDWSKSMTQNFEYYEVDPISWKDVKRLDNVKSCSIDRDITAETLGSASIDMDNTIGEAYIRVYLSVIQNGINSRIPLGVFLIQTPSSEYDGKMKIVSMDAYTPLIELKEKKMPIGYSLMKNDNILDKAYEIIKNNCRAPVVKSSNELKLINNFVSDSNDTSLRFVIDLLKQAKYSMGLDEYGKILLMPIQSVDKLQPVWTYTDDNSSILHPDIKLKHDIYGIPNVVEIISTVGTEIYVSRVVNDDPNSPTSTINRGREILHRVNSPMLPGAYTKEQVDEYAETLLKNLSSVDYEVTYTHGYCPVRLGDCVRLNYEKAELKDIKAKVISQSISCNIGCSVSETAIFTKKLWK